MEPGRELDALIAEKVMGWKITAKGRDHTWFRESVAESDLIGINPNLKPLAADGTNSYVPLYSKLIKAAWDAVDKLGLFNTDGSRCVGNILHKDGGFWVVQHRWGAVIARGETVPHVICLAALVVAKSPETRKT